MVEEFPRVETKLIMDKDSELEGFDRMGGEGHRPRRNGATCLAAVERHPELTQWPCYVCERASPTERSRLPARWAVARRRSGASWPALVAGSCPQPLPDDEAITIALGERRRASATMSILDPALCLRTASPGVPWPS